MSDMSETLSYAVMSGSFIPAHDATFDLAVCIAESLDTFRMYVTAVRDAEQATDALEELGAAIASGIYDATRPGYKVTA